MLNLKSNKAIALTALASAHALLIGTVGLANANDQFIPAVIACSASTGGSATPSFYGDIAVFTSSTGYVSCAANQDQALDTNDDFRIYMGDLNGDPGKNFSCFGYSTNRDFNDMEFTEQTYACGVSGGCSSDPGRYATGLASVTFENVRHGGGFAATFYCSIPPMIGSDYSFLKGIFIDEQ